MIAMMRGDLKASSAMIRAGAGAEVGTMSEFEATGASLVIPSDIVAAEVEAIGSDAGTVGVSSTTACSPLSLAWESSTAEREEREETDLAGDVAPSSPTSGRASSLL